MYLLRQFLASSGIIFLGLFVTWTTAEAVLRLDLFQASPSGALKLILFRTLEKDMCGLGRCKAAGKGLQRGP